MSTSNHTISTPRGIVTIRPAVPADAIAFSDLRQEGLRDNPTVFGSSYEFRENCTPEWAARVLAEDPQEICHFIAEYNQELLGMTTIRRSRGQKIRHQANLYGVFVRPAWRGLGIVDGIFEDCFAWARVQGIVIVKLSVLIANMAAVKAYQRMGFEITGNDPKSIFYDGVYYDEYYMAREV